MRYQTILVHLEDKHVFEVPLAYARKLAETYGAHLIGVTVMPAFNELPPAGTRVQQLIDQYRQSFRDEAAVIQAQLEMPSPGTTHTTEWRVVDPGFRPRLEMVAALAATADLVVTSQDDPDMPNVVFGDNAGLLVTQSPRPVIITPRQGGPWNVPRHVLVAWNGSAESARAVFDALPLMTSAESVMIVAIRSLEERTSGVMMQQLEDLCTALARHGIKADSNLEVPGDVGDGATILAAVKRHGSELLVMGGYGHSRLGQRIFGGVTRHVLQHMQTPVLLSH